MSKTNPFTLIILDNHRKNKQIKLVVQVNTCGERGAGGDTLGENIGPEQHDTCRTEINNFTGYKVSS